MQTMHRQFGKLMKRSADDSQVSVLLKDFEVADQLLSRIIESSKAWRDAWSAILTYQARLTEEFEGLYHPIIGSSEPTAHPPAITPQRTLARTTRLMEECEQLKTELLAEVSLVDERMIKPAIQARDYLQLMKKTIKKRDDKKLDFEHFQGRVDASRKKTKRSDRDNAVLAKAEIDLNRAREEYNAADDHLRAHLPPLISATFSMLPHLLHAQIEIQNTLLALYYTTLHNYCQEQQLPSPPPPMDVVVREWEQEFLPIQREFESIACVSPLRAIRPGRTSDDHKNGSLPLNGVNTRRLSSQPLGTKPSVSPIRTLRAPTPPLESRPRLNGSHHHNSAPSVPLSSPKPPVSQYLQHTPSDTSIPTMSPAISNRVGAVAAAAAAAAKKKPPPPPPPRPGQSSQAHFVTALYDFTGEGAGDLTFQEGDRIRVLKKTDSTHDWWEGELRGVKGSFPANYCS